MGEYIFNAYIWKRICIQNLEFLQYNNKKTTKQI